MYCTKENLIPIIFLVIYWTVYFSGLLVPEKTDIADHIIHSLMILLSFAVVLFVGVDIGYWFAKKEQELEKENTYD